MATTTTKGPAGNENVKDSKEFPLLTFQASPLNVNDGVTNNEPYQKNRQQHPRCPFGNNSISFTLYPGGCVRLHGPSGLGKTSLAMHIAGLLSNKVLRNQLAIQVDDCSWDPSLPTPQRCGVLFQQTTLLDELTVAGNLHIALQAAAKSATRSTSSSALSSNQTTIRRIKQLLDMVGLDYVRDAPKRVSQLSGGMARRASLALQLAQQKHVIVLDEPFAGLDYDMAMSVARELVHLRRDHKTALILISHEPDIAAAVMDPDRTRNNVTVTLEPPRMNDKIQTDDGNYQHQKASATSLLIGTSFRDRFLERLADYLLYSLPLILLAFVACGLAIAMLSADLMQRINVTDQLIAVIDTHVKPLLQLLTGSEPNALTMMGIHMKVRSIVNTSMPEAKATLYALGMTKLFVLEIGPLLTALLLAGRIGGSYAGKVATMQATSQNKLLQTLGISPVGWALWPALVAALLAAPVLTALGTWLALLLGGLVGQHHDVVVDGSSYWKQVHDVVFPELRLQSPSLLTAPTLREWPAIARSILLNIARLRATFTDFGFDTLVEIITYPPFFHVIKAETFILIVLLVAEVSARRHPDLTPRGVPLVITSSVVVGSLLVILADWGYSQLYLQRK